MLPKLLNLVHMATEMSVLATSAWFILWHSDNNRLFFARKGHHRTAHSHGGGDPLALKYKKTMEITHLPACSCGHAGGLSDWRCVIADLLVSDSNRAGERER